MSTHTSPQASSSWGHSRSSSNESTLSQSYLTPSAHSNEGYRSEAPRFAPSASAYAGYEQTRRNSARTDEMTARLLESAEYKAVCEAIMGSRDVHTAQRSQEYKAFTEMTARLEAERKAMATRNPPSQSKARQSWGPYQW